jgi:hypothetical protein
MSSISDDSVEMTLSDLKGIGRKKAGSREMYERKKLPKK